MELRYCDNCGGILKQEQEGLKLPTGGYLCSDCAPKQQPNTKAVIDSGSETNEKKVCAARAAKELSLSSLLDTGNLDLYSAETIARRKEESKRKSKTRVRLLDPDSPTSEAPVSYTHLTLPTKA